MALRRLRRSAGELGRYATYRTVRRVTDFELLDGAITVIGVYRRRNVRYVRPLVEAALAAGWSTAWWALDEVSDALATHTVGCGPGEKLPLLNEIIERANVAEGWIVVADDDIVFARGSVVELVGVCARAGFALAQPALAVGGTFSHEITLSRTLSIARKTTFVEVGPLVVIAPWCRQRVLPFPAWRGMGWGVEFEWHELLEHGFSFGIVDVISVVHLGRIGDFYDSDRLKSAMKRELASRGTTWRELQQTIATWRPWRMRPPWNTEPPQSDLT